MKLEAIPVDTIVYDERRPYRNTPLDYTTVWYYRERLRAGAVFPPITVTPDGEHYIIVDGYHRWAAYAAENYTTIACEIVEYTTPQERYLDSIRRNAQHGKQLSPIDIALIDSVASEWGIENTTIMQILHITPETYQRICARKQVTVTIDGVPVPIAKSWEPYKEVIEQNPSLVPIARRALGTSLPRLIRQLIPLIQFLSTETTLKYWDLLVELYNTLHNKLLIVYHQTQSGHSQKSAKP